MTVLSARDQRAALRVMQQLATVSDSEQFARCGAQLLGALVAAESTTLSACHPTDDRDTVTGLLHDPARNGRYVIAVPLQADDGWYVSFVLDRKSRDFSERERALLATLASGLGALYRHAAALDRARCTVGHLVALLQGTPIGSIRLGPRGVVRDFSPRAAEQAQRLWGARLRRGVRLPTPIAAALAGPPGGGRLTVRAFPDVDPGGLLVAIEETASGDLPRARWPLSARQQQVLAWVCAGKTDRDVGTILGISARTVGKHLQRIYDKLGVETRTAAAMRLRGG
jgi:DNA-binding CsgD family transcriptional regulator